MASPPAAGPFRRTIYLLPNMQYEHCTRLLAIHNAYIYIYIHMHVCMYTGNVCVYIYIYIYLFIYAAQCKFCLLLVAGFPTGKPAFGGQ